LSFKEHQKSSHIKARGEGLCLRIIGTELTRSTVEPVQKIKSETFEGSHLGI